MRLVALVVVLSLVLGVPGAFAHGGESGIEELAKQPAKILVKQAHAILIARGSTAEAAERLDAAELSKDKKGVDVALLEQGHQALENGNVDRAIALLEESLIAGAAAEKAKDEAPPEPEPAPASEPEPAVTAPQQGPEATTTEELTPTETEAADAAPPPAEEHGLDEEEAAEAVHGAAAEYEPQREDQELAAGIAGGILAIGAVGGLLWRRHRDVEANG